MSFVYEVRIYDGELYKYSFSFDNAEDVANFVRLAITKPLRDELTIDIWVH